MLTDEPKVVKPVIFDDPTTRNVYPRVELSPTTTGELVDKPPTPVSLTQKDKMEMSAI